MNIAKYIDHTALNPDTTDAQIRKLCEDAKQYGFVSVCVNPTWISLCSELLVGTVVKVCTVVGFPLGANLTESKAAEAKRAIDQGADEIDMVMNIGSLKSGRFGFVERDMLDVRQATKGIVLKVIIEACLLTDDEKVIACQIAQRADADFIKTSTGFSSGGATVEDVRLMRKTVGNEIGVKASGGIKDYAIAKAMIDAGANRLGCSASVAIVFGSKYR